MSNPRRITDHAASIRSAWGPSSWSVRRPGARRRWWSAPRCSA